MKFWLQRRQHILKYLKKSETPSMCWDVKSDNDGWWIWVVCYAIVCSSCLTQQWRRSLQNLLSLQSADDHLPAAAKTSRIIPVRISLSNLILDTSCSDVSPSCSSQPIMHPVPGRLLIRVHQNEITLHHVVNMKRLWLHQDAPWGRFSFLQWSLMFLPLDIIFSPGKMKCDWPWTQSMHHITTNEHNLLENGLTFRMSSSKWRSTPQPELCHIQRWLRRVSIQM